MKDSDEDIHTANERRLTEVREANSNSLNHRHRHRHLRNEFPFLTHARYARRSSTPPHPPPQLIGPLGGKLHTGRSRNDQVATDTRLYLVKMEKQIINHLLDLLSAGCKLAKETKSILCPGYTHLQPAQPIRFGHWIMSHMSPVVRDVERLIELIPRANQCPLGCGALAGNAFSVDREFLASDLGFDGVLPNSLDAVCDRDFVVEFLFWHSMFLSHLSQFSEDVIIMNLKKEVIISDAYATGSSLMPQKKNPDALELLRGKAGMALGRAVGFTATLKVRVSWEYDNHGRNESP